MTVYALNIEKKFAFISRIPYQKLKINDNNKLYTLFPPMISARTRLYSLTVVTHDGCHICNVQHKNISYNSCKFLSYMSAVFDMSGYYSGPSVVTTLKGKY
jgi:hypothetical protein